MEFLFFFVSKSDLKVLCLSMTVGKQLFLQKVP